MSGIGQQILGSAVVDKYKWLVLALFGLTIALTNEIFARYLANRPGSRKMPRKRIFVNSEQDVIRFVNNLTLDRVLEKNEAQL
ncbi:12760_t:CDS:2, partial [Cetraspora pellucida]